MLWWSQQDEDMRESVAQLVARGQLDFVNGGYVQHDEAAAHYVAMIDQTTRGHRCVVGRLWARGAGLLSLAEVQQHLGQHCCFVLRVLRLPGIYSGLLGSALATPGCTSK